MTEVFKLKVKVNKVIHYDKESSFGIFGCIPVDYNPKIEKNKYGNFALQGHTRRLGEDEEYEIEFEGTFSHPKFGSFYKIIKVEQEKLDSVEAQQKFLKAVVTPYQADMLMRAYPNEMIIDLIVEDKIDITRTKGIKVYTLAQIKNNVIKNKDIQELLVELESINITPKAIGKIVAHYKTAELALAAIRNNIYSLCDVSGFGFKKVDTFALERGENRKGFSRVFYCLKHVLEEAGGQGHTWMFEEEVFAKVNGLLDLYSPDLRKVITEVYNHDDFYVLKDKVSLRRYFNQEIGILSHLLRIRDNYKPDSTMNIEKEIDNQEQLNGIKYSEEQRLAIREGIESGVYIINGKGGTGKTTILKAIVNIQSHQSHAGVALSGKAANVLTTNGIDGMTIHRLLGRGLYGGFHYNVHNKLTQKIILLDETSMVNVGLAYSLIQAVEDGSKIIIVGDSGQLSGIGQGDMLRDLLATNLFKKRELKFVHRQAQDSGTLEIANRIREGEQITKFNSESKDVYGANNDMKVYSYRDKTDLASDIRHIMDAYAQNYIKTEEDIMNFQILVANKDKNDISTASLNAYAQSIFNKSTAEGMKYGTTIFKETDKVMVKGNTYGIRVYKDLKAYEEREEYEAVFKEYRALDAYSRELEEYGQVLDYDDEMRMIELKEALAKMGNRFYEEDLFNGTLGIIKHVFLEDKTVLIKFEGIDGLISIQQGGMDIIELAYAMTIHKSQGSTIKNIIVAVDFSAYLLLTRQLVYTAITRTSGNCVLLVENNALHKAIDTDNSGSRRTFLASLINAYQQGVEWVVDLTKLELAEPEEIAGLVGSY